MLDLIAINCTKIFSDLSVKSIFFCGVLEGVNLPIFNLIRLSYISQVKSLLHLFETFFDENFKYTLGTVDSSIGYQKNWRTSFLPFLFWVLSLKNKLVF